MRGSAEAHERGLDDRTASRSGQRAGPGALFHRFVEIVAACGEDNIGLGDDDHVHGPRRGFAGARPHRDRLLGYFDITYRVDDPRIRSAAPYQKDLFVHHFRVESLEQLYLLLPLDRARVRPGRVRKKMKLVTYDDGRVGYLDGEEIVRFDVPTLREWFERGGADETGERVLLAGRGQGADRAEEVLPHGRQLPRARGRLEGCRLVARDRAGSSSSRTSTRSWGLTSRLSIPST